MSIIARITYDEDKFLAQMQSFDVFKYDVKEALRYAVKWTTAAVNSDVRGELRKITGLSAKIIRGRIDVSFRYENHQGRIWIGLNPIDLKRMNPRQLKGSVKAGPVKREGAWIGKGKLGGHVFKRLGPGRLPIEKQVYNIEEQGEVAVETVKAKVQDYLKRYFIEYLERRRGSAKGRNAA